MPPFARWKSNILLAVLVLNGAFLFLFNVQNAQALYATSSYNKLFTDTLTSSNWNDLFKDFVNSWLPVSMNGPLAIGYGLAYTPNANYSLQVTGNILTDRLFSTGNIGIGTTNPYSNLHVVGSVDASGTVNGTGLCIGGVCKTDWGTVGATSGWTATGTTVYNTNLAGNVGIGLSNPDKKLVIKLNDAAGVDEFKVVDSAGVNAFNVDSDGNVLFGAYPANVNFNNANVTGMNNVAISDGGPQEGMTWADSAWSIDTSPLDRTNATGNLNLYGTANNIAFWRPTLWVYNAANYTTATALSSGLNFTTTGTGNISFNPGGNVGIGTSNPTSNLHVVGGVDVSGTVNGTGLCIAGDCRTSWVTAIATTSGWTVNGSTVYKTNTSGNIGIGITNPGAKLEIYESSLLGGALGNYQILTVLRNPGGSGGNNIYDRTWSVRDAAGTSWTTWREHNGLGVDSSYATPSTDRVWWERDPYNQIQSWGSEGSTWLTLNSGNVGIGTTDPNPFRLNVNGNANFASGVRIGSQSSNGWYYYPNVVSAKYDNNYTGAFIIHTNISRTSNEMFKIRVNGYGYGQNTNIDFTIVGYSYSGSTGSVDGAAGGVVSYSIVDNGNDGLPKWVGIDANGKVAVALGNIAANYYFYRLSADYWATRIDPGAYSGWSVDMSSVAGFGWLDIKTLSPAITQLVGGNVGVGVAAPTANLHVIGSTAVSGNLSATGGTFGILSGGGARIVMSDNSGNLYATSTTVATGLPSPSGNSGYTLRSNGSSWLANSVIYNNGTNVGVGTTAPGYKLDVTGVARATSGFITSYQQSYGTLTSGGAARDILQMAGDTNLKIGSTASAQDFTFQSTSGSLVTIKNTGNVGIGTANPYTKLDVAYSDTSTNTLIDTLTVRRETSGTAAAGLGGSMRYVLEDAGGTLIGTNKISSIWTDASATNRYARMDFYSAKQNTQNIAMSIDYLGNVGINKTNPGTNLDVVGGINASGSVNGTLLCIAGDCRASWNAAGAYWTGYGNNIANNNSGNIGVGTTNPTQKLDISGNIIMSGGVGGNWISDNGIGYFGQGSIVTGGATTDTAIRTSGNLLFSSGGATERMRINNSGNVGIGMTSPAYKLDVTGTMRINSGSAVSGFFQSTADTQISLVSSDSWSGINFNDSGSVNDALYHNGVYGTFSIGGGGSSVSGKKLHIEGGTSIGTSYRTLAVPTNGLAVEGNVGIGTTTPSTKLQVYGNGTYSASFMNGNVGINKTNPGTNLDVVGGINASGSVNGTLLCIAGDCRASWNAAGAYWTGYGNNIANNNSGNVGIGTTNPLNKFQISAGNASTASTSPFAIVKNEEGYGLFFGIEGSGNSWLQSSTRNNSAKYNLTLQPQGGNTILNPVSGNVGIGTTIPNTKLEVSRAAGDILNSGSGASSTAFLRLQNNSGGLVGDIGLQQSSPYGMWLQTTNRDNLASTYPLLLNPNGGNVGVGTTNPVYPLDVKGFISQRSTVNNSLTNVSGWSGNAGGYHDIYYDGVVRVHLSAGSASGASYITNGNVGIGTTNPTANLHVIGSTAVSGNLSATGGTFGILAGGGARIVVTDNSGNLSATSTSVATGVASPSGNSGYTLRSDGTSWVANSVLYNNGNNIGIGTTVPATTLDVNGVVNAMTGYRIANAATTGSYLRGNGTNFVSSTIQASDVPTLNQNTTGSAYYVTSRDTRAVNDAPQDFGQLVKFDFKANSTNGLSDGGSYNGVMTWRRYGSSTDFSGGPALQLSYSDNGNLWTRISTSSSTWGAWAQVLNSGTGVKLQSATPGTVQNGNLNISGVALFGSNVGINKTSPGTNLDVVGGINASGSVNGTLLCIAGDCRASWNAAGAYWTGYGNNIANNNSGNVGIGTTTPSEKLTVYGNLDLPLYNNWRYIKNSATNGGLRLGTGNASGTYVDGIEISSGGGYIKLNHNTTVNGSLYTTGSIGVGTSTPVANLQVIGSTRIGTYDGAYPAQGGADSLNFRTATTDYAYIKGEGIGTSDAGGLGIFLGDDVGTFFRVSNNVTGEMFRITGNGNVGMGTSNPGSKLEVANGQIFVNSSSTPSIKLAPGDSGSSDTTRAFFGLATGANNFISGSVVNDTVLRGNSQGGLLFGLGNTEYMRVSNSGNVGINKTTPGATLDVVGGINASGIINGTGLCIAGDCRTSWVTAIATTSGWTVDGSTVYKTNTSGNVGIGISSPSAKLQVANETVNTAALKIGQTIATTNSYEDWTGLDFTLSNQVTQMTGSPAGRISAYLEGSNNGFGLDFWTRSDGATLNRVMRINRSGNVGIGTTNPGSYRLNVSGNTYLNGTLTLSSKNISGVTNLDIQSGDGYGVRFWSNDSYKISMGNSGEYHYGPVTDYSIKSAMTSTTGRGWTWGTTSVTPVAALSNTGAFQIAGNFNSQGAGNNYFAGNVGIGTTNPTANLHVVTSGSFSGNLSATGGTFGVLAGGGSRIVVTDNSGNLSATSTSVATGVASPSGVSGYTLRSNGTSWVANSLLYNNGTNVGINTTNPGAKLDVAGDIWADNSIALTNTISGVNPGKYPVFQNFHSGNVWRGFLLGFNTFAQTSTTTVTFSTDGTNNEAAGIFGSSALNFYTRASTGNSVVNAAIDNYVRMTISANGNVGVGTITPATKLHVASPNTGTKFIVDDSYTANGKWGLAVGIPSANDTSFRLRHESGNLDVLTALTNGFIGIGTTNPGSKLEINYTSGSSTDVNLSSNYGIKIKNTAWQSSQLTGIEFWNGYQKVVPTSRIISQMAGSGSAGDNLLFQTQSNSATNPNPNQPTTKLIITSNGNVGIGTTNPTANLHVVTSGSFSGNLSATGGTFGVLAGGGSRIVVTDNSGNLSATSTSVATGVASPSGNSGYTLRSDGTSWVANSVLYNNGTNIGIGGTTTPQANLHIIGSVRIGEQNRTNWPSDAPIYQTTLYGTAGDIPFRTASTSPITMNLVYGPFGYANPSCDSSHAKWYRLYAEYVDNIQSGGQLPMLRIDFSSGTDRDFAMSLTWGSVPNYRTYLSAPFQETNTNHANIQTWVSGTAGPYVEIRKVELWAYCL